MASKLTFFVSLTLVSQLAGCGESGNVDSSTGGGGAGSGGMVGTGTGGGNLDFGGGPSGTGGAPMPTCTPSPNNFEVPANGCDDDGDGQVDNVTASCDSGTLDNKNPLDFAKAIGLCQQASGSGAGLISAQFTNGYQLESKPADAQIGIHSKFGAVLKPLEGGNLGVLSSGFANEFNDATNTAALFNASKVAMVPSMNAPQLGQRGAVPAGFPAGAEGCPIASEVYDQVNARFKIKVPQNAKGFSFDFNFLTGEWPTFVCSQYNDSFIAYLTPESGEAKNLSFDSKNNAVSVNNGFFDRCTDGASTGCFGTIQSVASCPAGPEELAGTGFGVTGFYCGAQATSGGGTGWLTTNAEVTPGSTITLEFMIWDTGDGILDSSVLLDNFKWIAGEVTVGTVRTIVK